MERNAYAVSWLGPYVDDDKYDSYDESLIRVRPNPKANRPRTKRRPDYSDAEIGMVTGVDRGRYTVLFDIDVPKSKRTRGERVVLCARARELTKTSIVTGDRVRVVGDTSGREGTLGRIVAIEDRRTLLRRSADDSDRVERVIVANADQMLIVVAAANPEPRVRLVDRYLVAAYDAGIRPILCITKTDLADPEPFLEHFASLSVPVFRSQPGAEPVDAIRRALLGHETVFVGHSGVGKSTLINTLVEGADRATGDVNEVTGRGRHTSSSTVALRIHPEDHDPADSKSGWVIDTPGVRSFGLGHVTADGILRGFTDLAAIIESCPRGCTHRADAPDCALDERIAELRSTEGAPAEGADDEPTDESPADALARRVDSLRRLLD